MPSEAKTQMYRIFEIVLSVDLSSQDLFTDINIKKILVVV